ncbi:hypothetical protein V8G54_028462, partial [Vigna mungo]
MWQSNERFRVHCIVKKRRGFDWMNDMVHQHEGPLHPHDMRNLSRVHAKSTAHFFYLKFWVWGFWAAFNKERLNLYLMKIKVSVVKLPSSWEFCGVCGYGKSEKEKGFGGFKPQLQLNAHAKAS